MKLEQLVWTARHGWEVEHVDADFTAPQLVLYFAAPRLMEDGTRFAELQARYPGAVIAGCSTGGEIANQDVVDGAIAVNALHFDHSHIVAVDAAISGAAQSYEAGRSLVSRLPQAGLRAVFLLCDGTMTNGTFLLDGVRSELAAGVVITGGLAGDGADFGRTVVGLNQSPQQGQLLAIGFYGERLRIGHGSFGGWDTFGPERRITRSDSNVLHELDGEPALALYKRYLGEAAGQLPGSALLFPLAIRPEDDEQAEVVRTVVGIDEASDALIFAGEMPVGYIARLMRGNFDRLVEGAAHAADAGAGAGTPALAIMVSCIGRKLLMGQRIVEEVEAVAEALGPDVRLTGFYSYGEIAPHGFTGKCELHNQTMTITVLAED